MCICWGRSMGAWDGRHGAAQKVALAHAGVGEPVTMRRCASGWRAWALAHALQALLQARGTECGFMGTGSALEEGLGTWTKKKGAGIKDRNKRRNKPWSQGAGNALDYKDWQVPLGRRFRWEGRGGGWSDGECEGGVWGLK